MCRRQICLQIACIRCIGRHARRAPACALTCAGTGAYVHTGFHADGVEAGEVVGFGAAEVEAAVEAELGFYGGGGCVEGEAVRSERLSAFEFSLWREHPLCLGFLVFARIVSCLRDDCPSD